MCPLALISVNHRLVAPDPSRSQFFPVLVLAPGRPYDSIVRPLPPHPIPTVADYTLALCLRLIITCTAGMLMPERVAVTFLGHLTIQARERRRRGINSNNLIRNALISLIRRFKAINP